MYFMVSLKKNCKITIISLVVFFAFGSLVMTKPVRSEDSPPNPEDGELWIPSDVFQEIISSNYQPQNITSPSTNSTPSDQTNRVNVAPNMTCLAGDGPRKHQTPSPQPKPRLKPQLVQVYQCGFPPVVPRNWNGSVGHNVIINNNFNRYYYNHYNYYNVQMAPRPIHVYNPMYQPRLITPSPPVIHRHVKRDGFGGANRGGTGVFLPHSATPNRKTGISLNQYTDQKIPANKNNPSSKNVQHISSGTVAKFATMDRQGKVSTVTKNLPNDWTY